jgi:hypothetical protein
MDLFIGKVAFRFHAPDAALRMSFSELRYFYQWALEVAKYERG